MRTSTLVLIALACLTTPASSTDYAVSPGGTGVNSLTYANTNAVAGDRVFLSSGTYNVGIAPANGGTSGSRIVYMGDQGNPTAAIVPLIQLGANYYDISASDSKGDYVTVKWVKSIGDVSSTGEFSGNPAAFRWADYDSIYQVTVDGSSATLTVTGHRCLVQSLVMTGANVNLVSAKPDSNYAPIYQYGQHNKLADCTFTLTSVANANMWYQRTCIADTILRCRVTATATTAMTDAQVINFYNSHNMYIADSYFDITNNSNAGLNCVFAFNVRDSVRDSYFLRDTVLVRDGSSHKGDIVLNNGGTTGACGSNRYEACVFKNAATATNFMSAAVFQDTIWADTLQFCSFVAVPNYNALIMNNIVEANSIFRHNLFYTGGRQAVQANVGGSSGSVFSANVLYTNTAPNNTSGSYAVLHVGTTTFASADSNLLFYSGSSGTDSTASVAVGNSPTFYAPSAWSSRSFWRSPSLFDSTASAGSFTSPDIRPGELSWAVGAVWADAFVGPYVPPSRVTELSISNGKTSQTVSWTAPGCLGAGATASAYDLRVADSVFGERNFYSQGSVSTDSPLDAGANECYLRTSLASCTPQYYAVRAQDDQGVWGAVSSLANGTTRCSGSVEVECVSGNRRASGEGGTDESAPPAGRTGVWEEVTPSGDTVLHYRFAGAGLQVPATVSFVDVAGRVMSRVRLVSNWDGSGRIPLARGSVAGRGLPRGVYFVRVEQGGRSLFGRAIVR